MTSPLVIVLLAMVGGAIRVSTPFMFVALGECLTEKSGRINLGLEGTLVLGAMLGYAVDYETGSPWLGVLAGGGAGLMLGVLHALLCSLPKVNDIAIGIALMRFGIGVAFFFGKPFIQPEAAHLPVLPLGGWSSSPQLAEALQINPLFIIGIAAAIAMWWAFRNTRWGLIVRTTGDSAPAGQSPCRKRKGRRRMIGQDDRYRLGKARAGGRDWQSIPAVGPSPRLREQEALL